MNSRPEIAAISSGRELRKWYWRKDELVPHARNLGLKTGGNKFVVLERIAHFLDTGEKTPANEVRHKPKSKFDWHSSELSKTTEITDNYKNTQNVRRFFKNEIGQEFKFNIAFMDWIKVNEGRTLADACEAYREIKKQQAKPGFKTSIKSHNQFNQYTRDFLEDNPELNIEDVRRVWARKTQIPSKNGRHIYTPSDLEL